MIIDKFDVIMAWDGEGEVDTRLCRLNINTLFICIIFCSHGRLCRLTAITLMKIEVNVFSQFSGRYINDVDPSQSAQAHGFNLGN